MPKKPKRESQKLRKKKVSTAEFSADNPLANTVINIVDPGESGIDITEEIRRKEEAAKKLVLATNIVSKERQTFIQTTEEVQAIRKELKGDEIVSEIDEFSVLKPKNGNQKKSKQENSQTYLPTISLAVDNVPDSPESQDDVSLNVNLESQSLMTPESNQMTDSLAVNIGSVNTESQSYSRQTTMESQASVNSSFSYFSDSNLVQRGDSSPTEIEQVWSQAESSISSNVQEGIFSNESRTSVTQTIQTAVRSTKKISKKQVISSESGNDSDVFLESAMEAKEENRKQVESASIISEGDEVEVKKRSHVSPEPGDEGDVFLEELKNEILEKEKEILVQKRQHVSQEPGDEGEDFLEELKKEVLETKEEKEVLEKKEAKEILEKKRQHVSPEPGDEGDAFLEELKNEVLETKEEKEKGIFEKKGEKKKKLQKKSSGWDNIFIKKEISLGLKNSEGKPSSTSSEDEDQWKEQLKKIKRKGVILEEKTLHTYFEEVQTKVFDTELGYGYVSENAGQPKIKIVLKGNSPFLNNEMKTLHFRLANLHLYSQVYRVIKAINMESGRTFYIFRHYLHLPSMTMEEIASLKIAACHDGHDTDQDIEFMDPLYVDDDFVVVEQQMFAWFLVVSEFPNLPIRVNFVPFMKRTNGPSPIFICPLPRGRHHISKVMNENPGWRKCGYEEPCVIQKGLVYNFCTDVWGEKENIGTMKIETWGHDTNWVVYKPEMFKPQNFIESTLSVDGSNEFVFSGPLSLYDRLRVDVEVPFYQKKITSWEIATIDQAILADLPPYGRISNLEPFFAYVRAGRLSIAQLKAILTHMGYSNVPDPSSALADTKISTLVQTYLQDWKEKNGSQATLVEFLTVLRMADVALTNIAREIIQNISNSKCGIAAYSIN